MKLQKLPSGSYRIQVQKDGKRYSFTGKDKEIVKRNAETFMKRKADITTTPLGECIDKYIEIKRNVLSPSTIKGYEQIRQAYLPELMKTPIQDLNSIVMQRAINVISANHSPKTVRNIYGLISSVIKLYAPALSFAVRLPQKRRVVYNLPTTQEVAYMVAESPTEPLRTAIMLAAFCGLRRGEIIALTSDDITDGIIHVHQSAVYDSDGNTIIKAPKTYSSDRYVTMPDIVREQLANISGKVCPIGLSTLTRQFVALRNRLGLSCRFHDLRHYYASFQHAIGIPDQDIMQSGGWRSDAILKSVYRNTLGEMQKQNNDKINTFISCAFCGKSGEKSAHKQPKSAHEPILENKEKPQKSQIFWTSTAFDIHGRNGARTRE
jgi:integrase